MIQVLGCRVAAIQPRLVGHHAEPRADRVEVVRNAQPIQLDQPCVGMQDSAETSQRRRLAGSVLAEEDQDLAALDVKVHAAHRRHVTETLAKAFDADHL